MNEIQNNKVNLCDSCSQVYPDCTSQPENVYFGGGIGHDNICACSEYQPSAQPEHEVRFFDADHVWIDHKQFISLQRFGEAVKDAQPQWISVTEMLPEVGQWVLCQCRAGIIDVLRLTDDGCWYRKSNEIYMSGFVYAWMPLPEPYKGEEG